MIKQALSFADVISKKKTKSKSEIFLAFYVNYFADICFTSFALCCFFTTLVFFFSLFIFFLHTRFFLEPHKHTTTARTSHSHTHPLRRIALHTAKENRQNTPEFFSTLDLIFPKH
uniref:(northern house mosquito) hypothetical protein n=1 Tax=Culex pipiens TaxID=7175 RepID=A0A8D8NSY2_CULPI